MAGNAGDTATGTGHAQARGWLWVLVSGMLLVLAGLVALAAPGITTVSLALFLGWLLLLVGIAGLLMGARARRRHRRWTDILYGAISILVAVLILANPLQGALSVTLAFAFWLGLRGAVELGGAFRARGAMRGVLVATGLINILLAVLLFANFPFPAVQAIGLFVGLSFLFGGAVTIAAALGLRRIEQAPAL